MKELTPVEIAAAYAEYFTPRVSGLLREIDKAVPGLSGTAIRQVRKRLKALIDGGIVVLAGACGTGKTVAAALTCCLYAWETRGRDATERYNEHRHKTQRKEFEREKAERDYILANGKPEPPVLEPEIPDEPAPADEPIEGVTPLDRVLDKILELRPGASAVACRNREAQRKHERDMEAWERAQLEIPEPVYVDSLSCDDSAWEWHTAREVIANALAGDYLESLMSFDGLLVIDDLGMEYFREDTGWGNSLWDEVFDRRYSERAPMLVTTNLTQAEFAARYGERIASRIQEAGGWIEVKGKNLRQVAE